MGMNPETGEFKSAVPVDDKEMAKKLAKLTGAMQELVYADGTPIPNHHIIFKVNERIVVKDHTFEVVYIGAGEIVIKPVKPTDALKCAQPEEQPNGKG